MSNEPEFKNDESVIVGPQLEYIDIINATKIMEAAIDRKAFTIKELGEIAPIVSRFQDFAQAILDEQTASTENEGE